MSLFAFGMGELYFVEYQKHLILKKSFLGVLNIDVFKKWIQDWINSRGLSVWICRRYQKGNGKGTCPDFRWVPGAYMQRSHCCQVCISICVNLSMHFNVCWKGVLEVKGMLKCGLSAGSAAVQHHGDLAVPGLVCFVRTAAETDGQGSVLTNTFKFILWSTRYVEKVLT